MAYANFFKHLLYLFLGLLMLWGVHIVELSLVSFFHFLLDHRLAVIETWVFDKAWEMILLAKVLPVLFLLKFVYLNSESRHPLRDQFLSGVKIPNYQIWVVIAASLILVVLFTRPILNPEMTQWNGFKTLVSSFSLFVFFMSDVFFVDALDRMYPIGGASKIMRNFLYALGSFFITKLVFLHAVHMTPFFGMTLFFVLTLHQHRGNWLETSFYLLFFLVPALTFLGLDFIWGKSFSIYVVQSEGTPALFLGIYLSCIFYVSYFGQRPFRFTKTSRP